MKRHVNNFDFGFMKLKSTERKERHMKNKKNDISTRIQSRIIVKDKKAMLLHLILKNRVNCKNDVMVM